ncbi:uncharacterized protein [Parasteatoda tepidariorum]|uniref:uncharacterized protein n=1 Tax=Parasteatoda tepidariorum TaxID=114398 RepID=UPI0039BC53AC
MEREFPETSLERIEQRKEFKGQEEEAIYLRQKIDKVRLHIRELEDGLSEQPQQPECHCTENSNIEKIKIQAVVLEIPSNQQEKFRLYENCCKIKSKFEYWKIRNKELKEDSDRLQLQLNQLLQNEKNNQEMQNKYHDVDRDLRNAMNEKLHLRSKLDCSKTRNLQLLEESVSLKEDLKKMDIKIKDDNMLLEALTSQQNAFQEFINRQKLITRNGHHLFLKDMKNIEVKHKTTLSQYQEMEEVIKENDAILSEFEDPTPLLINITFENDPAKIPSVTTMASDLEGVQRTEEPLKELKRERDIWISDVEQHHAENIELKETIFENNDRLIDWINQFLHCETKLIEKEMEVKKLKMAIEKGEKGIKKKSRNLENSQQTATEDNTVKEAIYLMESFVLERFLHATESLSTKFINLYVVTIDKMIRMFVEKLHEIRRELFSKMEDSTNVSIALDESKSPEIPEESTNP